MNKLIGITLHYESDYSSYKEDLFIMERDFNEYFGGLDLLEGEEIFVGELDGKHSECYGSVSIEIYDIDQLNCNITESASEDGHELRNYLTDGLVVSFDEKIELFNRIRDNVNKELNNLDLAVDLGKFKVKRSQQPLVRRIVQLFIDNKINKNQIERFNSITDEKISELINSL